MEPEACKPAPDDQTTWTLYCFCLRHRLPLNNHERSAVGIELSKLARERQLPLKRVRERVGPGQWSRSHLYPEPLLNEWLTRYTAQAQATAGVERSPEACPAANG